MDLKTIEEQLLFTTLRIESLNERHEVKSIGTGFLLRKEQIDKSSHIYLISNKHVLDYSDSIRITFSIRDKFGNPTLSNRSSIVLNDIKRNLRFHENQEVDIATLRITNIFNLMPDIFMKYIDYSMLATFNEELLSVAQNVYFVGYPDNKYDEINNLPLIRSGMISSHPKVDFNNRPIFIIDAQVFPGSSGSPVFVNLTYEKIRYGQIKLGGSQEIKLLGIVSSTYVRNNQLTSIPTRSSMSVIQEVIGLGIVFKSTAIKQVIDSFDMK